MARQFRDSFRSSEPAAITSAPPLPSPIPDLGVALSAADLRATAYELLVAASRATGAKPLTYIPQSAAATSTADGKLKGAFGLGSSASSNGGGGTAAVLELVRARMGITEQADARIRRALLRVAAGQLGRHAESVVWPLEFLQKCKASDFRDPLEYEAWQTRNFKLLEAGLLVHTFVPLKRSDVSAKRMRKIIQEAYDGQLETGRNSDSMQRLRGAVRSLACRSLDETSDECHWADGFPLNLHIYKMLVEACFDVEKGTVVEEIDETMELLKKTWLFLGVNQMLHNLYFTWALFNHFVMFGQTDKELLSAIEHLLLEVAKDAKITKDPDYCDVLSSTLSSIIGWIEKRMLAYHETFNTVNISSLQYIVSIAISTAKILVEDMSHEYGSGAKRDIDVVRSRIETYIHSSLRTSFVQKMEQADSKQSSGNGTHVLSILAKKTRDLAIKEKNLYSPILKKWHPLAPGVAVATLHACFGDELKQFTVGLTELTPDTAEMLKEADKLEKDLIHIAIEDSMDIDDRGKSWLREMPPYEAGTVLANLLKTWVQKQVDKLKGWADHKLQQETWNPKDNSSESFAPSSVEMLHIIEETLDAFFHFSIPTCSTLFANLAAGLDKCLHYYVSRVKSGCGTWSTHFPRLPHLTRCDVGSKLFKKNEKPQLPMKQGSQVGSVTGNEGSSLPGLCFRINTLHYIQDELENLGKTKTYWRNAELAQPNIADGLDIKFKLSRAACQEGIRQLCETTAYMVIFNDLSHILMDTLYVGSPASNRILPFLKELRPILRTVSSTVHNNVRNHLVTALMKASFDGFLLVLLAGGPTRAFCCQDYQIIEDDFRALRGLYLTYSDGLPEELVAKASSEVKSILPLLRTDTETLLERFKKTISESYECTTKSRFPMPPVPSHWSPDNPNTILRVLCYRNDEAATKFLKKTYDLPKML